MLENYSLPEFYARPHSQVFAERFEKMRDFQKIRAA